MEFVINLTNNDLLKAVDWCGMKSGRDYNKFREMGLNPVKAGQVDAPLIEEAPVNIECRVIQIIPLGSHHMFMAEIVAVNYHEKYLDEKTGGFSAEKAGLVNYAFKHYFSQGEKLGKYGFSLK